MTVEERESGTLEAESETSRTGDPAPDRPRAVGRLDAARHELLTLDRLLRFGLVGFVGMTVDMAVLGILFTGVGLPIWLSKLVAAEAAILVMFLSNERWTFATTSVRQGWLALARRLLRSNLVRVGGITVATTVLVVGHDVFGIWWPIANLVGIGCGFTFNYVLESLYTWRVTRP